MDTRVPENGMDDMRDERVRKLVALRAAGIEPYPITTERTHEIAQVRETFDELERTGAMCTIVGRITAIREHGGSVFIDLFDGSGSFQGFLKRDVLSEGAFAQFSSFIDRGDFIAVTGTPFRTKRGELSLIVHTWRLLAKGLRPIPTEHFGIRDEDERYRKRYLDILLDHELAARIRRRSIFWNAIRTFLIDRGFVEVETPVLETTPGGAEARPFVTHHNALDIDVHLRISAGELWQKKLMVAGIPRTFEIGRIFRNEGMSFEHLQDYTQLELYEAYSDLEKGKVLIQDLYRTIARETFQSTSFSVRGIQFDLNAAWDTYDFAQIMRDAYGFDPRSCTPAEVTAALAAAGHPTNVGKERGVDLLWKKCRTALAGPGFLVNVPVYLEPLAKRSAHDPRVVDRFQVVLAGSEVGKGFSELNDPIDQAERFARQQELREQGDEEAQFADTEYVEALEYGMPPTFGFGMSERLFSFLEGVSIREAQIFPLMRPRHSA